MSEWVSEWASEKEGDIGRAEASAASTMKQRCTITTSISPPFACVSAFIRLPLISPYLSRCIVSTLSLPVSLWASVILSFSPIPIFNLSRCNAPFLFFKPVIYSFLCLPSISLCLCSCVASLLKHGPWGSVSLPLAVKTYNRDFDKSRIWVAIMCEHEKGVFVSYSI